MSDCLFCKIVAGSIPAKKIYEDEECLAFHDIRPIAPVHFMLVPKRHIASLMETSAEDVPLLGRLLALAPKLAHEQGLEDGFKTGINTGHGGGQEVFHLHIHIFGHPRPA